MVFLGRDKIKGSTSHQLAGFALVIGSILLFSNQLFFPGYWAAIPVFGTGLTIVGNGGGQFSRAILSNRILVGIGLISYPLYLWHWPLLSFAYIVGAGTGSVGPAFRLAIIATSIFLALATYRLVEVPIRFGAASRKSIALLCLFVAVISLVGLGVYLSEGAPKRQLNESYNHLSENISWIGLWDDQACVKRFNMSPCQLSAQAVETVILGDSHANQLFPGLAKKLSTGVFSGGTCPPLLDITFHTQKMPNICETDAFLQANLKIIASAPNIRNVVLSAFWSHDLALERARDPSSGRMFFKSSRPDEASLGSAEMVYRGLVRTVEYLEGIGKFVFFVRDAPALPTHISSYCLDRIRLFAAPKRDCVIERSAYETSRLLEDDLVEKLKQKFPKLVIVDPIERFCDTRQCYVMRDGTPYIRDLHHLSVAGSDVVGSLLADAITRSAANAAPAPK